MRKERLKRIIACYLALNLLFEVISPSLALALTSGPAQPEMASFEPVGTTQMVDLFSGNFNYNIPLLTVPGPNGGYPVNLAYHSGIGMDEEASWVGLGWNINPGSITRQMRGLPDDFNGAKINKQVNMNPNRTANLNFRFPFKDMPEIFGFKYSQSMSLGLTWNNYQGVGVTTGFSPSFQSLGQGMVSPGFGLSLNYNSLSGDMNMTSNFSLSGKTAQAGQYSFAYTVNSVTGLKDMTMSASRSGSSKYAMTGINMIDGPLPMAMPAMGWYGGKNAGASTVSYASSSFVPHTEMPQSGFSVNASFKLGAAVGGVYSKLDVHGAYSQTKYKDKNIDFSGFGYLYSQNRVNATNNLSADNDDYSLMDFNREKDAPLSKDIPSMPVPIPNYDVYMVNGQGTGGAFRPYRTDIGLLVDPEITSKHVGGTLGLEVGPGAPIHFGVDAALSYSKSYTGPWKNANLWDDIKGQIHKGTTYFKSAGEMVANTEAEKSIDMQYKNFPLASMISPPDLLNLSVDPVIDIRVNNTNGIIGAKDHYDTRRTRSQLMSYKTFQEVNDIPGYKDAWVTPCVYNENATTPASYTYPSPASTIAEMSVVNPDGNRYIYALPAINNSQKEASFSIQQDNSNRRIMENGKIVNFVDGADNTQGNQQLDDHFFSSTQLPAYVHSYMLTAIVSPDYIDLTGDGPSKDDFGYWVKFNYTRTSSNFKWRAPFLSASLMRGHLSTDNDDKAGYTYGDKEIWYLNSIETKTHIARFTLGTRGDAYGADSEGQQYGTGSSPDQHIDGNNPLRRLEKISLYARESMTQPIKEVNFTYNYELCKGTWNSNQATNPDKGKLTLKAVSFSYLGNNKGALSPYQFDYRAGDSDANPGYSPLSEDRWGNYRPNEYGVDNTIFPYSSQRSTYNLDQRNKHASAWALSKITLPSGGQINIDYEADDYAYVHDRPAMEMARVLGVHESWRNVTSLGDIQNTLKDKNLFVFFEINDPGYVDASTVKNYTQGMSQLYFNMYLDLKRNGAAGNLITDYVDGYTEIVPDSTGFLGTFPAGDGNNIKVGYIYVKHVPVHDIVGGFPYTHPFMKASWQYLKLERPDILNPSSSNNNVNSGNVTVSILTQLANSVLGAFQSSTQLFTGFNSYCRAMGWGREINTSKPSFIRLNTPDGIKYGGGHRVKQLAISDSWQESSIGNDNQSLYGQEYNYRLPDGRSSGVASYEPLIGGEEIPYRMPIRYTSPYFIFKNKNLYMEEPVGESYYPFANVGYSRVTVKNIAQHPGGNQNQEATKSREGITVNEFYTSKDFPYSITRSAPQHEKFNPKIMVPFIGSVSFEDHGFSQWMDVVTNDMNGKPKSVATYVAGTNVNDPNNVPVSKIEYIYNTNGTYNPNGANSLNTKVNVLFGDGDVRETDIGLTSEQYIDMRESSGVSTTQGLQMNLDYSPVFFTLSFVPSIDYSESLFKSVVAMHMTNRMGILMETRAFSEGSTVSTKNLMFDAYTGQPLLTSVTNDFDKPIYSYNYNASWSYPQMGNAYTNDRLAFDFGITSSPGELYVTSSWASVNDLVPGDEMLVTYGSTRKRCWIKDVNQTAGTATIINEDGSNFGPTGTGYHALIIRSGKRNQQAVSNGAIVSLSNPVAERRFGLFDAYNAASRPVSQVSAGNCSGQVTKPYDVSTHDATLSFFGTSSGSNYCTFSVDFPTGVSAAQINANANYHLKRIGKQVQVLDMQATPTPSVVCTGTITDNCGLSECLDGVLNASSAVFNDTWTYDYGDIGSPEAKYSGGSSTSLATVVNGTYNPYRIGTKGIWRTQKTYAYQTRRTQNLPQGSTDYRQTKIQEAGTFASFSLFDWTPTTPDVRNLDWTMANQVTKYSPHGFEVENKNAINIYTAALYGYANSVPTAIASNATYYETAFDGFEDYASTVVNYPSSDRHGHIPLTFSGTAPFRNVAHTGKKSIEMSSGQSVSIGLENYPNLGNAQDPYRVNNYYLMQTVPGKKYTVSAWMKLPDGVRPTVSLSNATGLELLTDETRIEGWQKIELNFIAGTGTHSVQIALPSFAGVAYLDDIRIQPFKSGMKTYVYDPATLWLMAELDNQNYATFYNYDEEGTLVQVKKETVRGVQTLKTTRSNTRRTP